MARPKGGPKYGGRKAGTPNKLSGSVKASLQAVYQLRGGDDALLGWARENETEFYKLWGRMLPQEVSGPEGGPIELAGIERIIRHAKD